MFLSGRLAAVAYFTGVLGTSVFYLFRDSPHRRAALGLEPGSPARYSLYGLDQLVERGYAVRHNLD